MLIEHLVCGSTTFGALLDAIFLDFSKFFLYFFLGKSCQTEVTCIITRGGAVGSNLCHDNTYATSSIPVCLGYSLCSFGAINLTCGDRLCRTQAFALRGHHALLRSFGLDIAGGYVGKALCSLFVLAIQQKISVFQVLGCFEAFLLS